MKAYTVPRVEISVVKEEKIKESPLLDSKSVSHIMATFFKSLQTDRENLVGLYLDTKNKPVGINHISMGTLNSSLVHPREVIKPAILLNAYSIILAHNHPSGNILPSNHDKSMTERINNACQIMGFKLLDHLILGFDGDYFSFNDKGLISPALLNEKAY